ALFADIEFVGVGYADQGIHDAAAALVEGPDAGRSFHKRGDFPGPDAYAKQGLAAMPWRGEQHAAVGTDRATARRGVPLFREPGEFVVLEVEACQMRLAVGQFVGLDAGDDQ